MVRMMSFTQNEDTTTKWPIPYIGHYLVDMRSVSDTATVQSYLLL